MKDTTFFPASEIIYELHRPGDRKDHGAETDAIWNHCMCVMFAYAPEILATAGFNINQIKSIAANAVERHDEGKVATVCHLERNTGISEEERNNYKLAHVLQGAILLDSEYSRRNLNEANSIFSLAIRLFHHYIIPNGDGKTYPEVSQIPELSNLQQHIEPIHRYIVGVALSKSNEELVKLAKYSSQHGEQLYFLAGLSTIILNFVDQIEVGFYSSYANC